VVLREATSDPAYLDTSAIPLLSSSTEVRAWRIPWNRPDRDRFRSRTKTALSIVRVSRAWLALAFEFLYEHIHIRSQEQYQALMYVLRHRDPFVLRMRDLSEDTSRPLGWYIKALSFETRIWWKLIPKGPEAGFLTLFRFCPDLRILQTFQNYNSSQQTISLPGLCELGKSLRYCRIFWELLGTSDSGPTTLLESLQNYGILEVLDLFVIWSPSFPDCRISLPKAHTMVIQSFSSAALKVLKSIAKWDLPSLQSLSLNMDIKDTFLENGQSALHSFFDAHGGKLLHLNVWHRPLSITSQYFVYCAVLEDLQIELRQLTPSTPSLSTLRRIRLDGMIHEEHLAGVLDSFFDEAMSYIYNMERPVLATIQLTRVQASENEDALKVWAEKWKTEGVEFVDQSGSIITYGT
jgi:hypothetical protein